MAIAVGAAAALPTPDRSAIETLPGHLVESGERVIGRAADRVTAWLEGRARGIGNGSAAPARELGDTAGPVKKERVRIHRGPSTSGKEDRVRIHRGPSTASRPALSGSVRVVDGDTLDVAGARVRLHGIDAPESAQRCRASGRSWPCGREAARALASRIGDRRVSCEERDRDRYGRVVAVCAVAGLDLNEWMVSEGWAFAYRRYSRHYVAAESRARAARRGIWRGEVVAPWEWRRGRRLPGSSPAARRNDGECRIKGNIGRDGRRIYHVPGGQYYDRTRIDTSRGERWFCSEREARAAGWRRSRR
ncbi:MAG: thermonuclease family protein [Defluviicoccus sp.]|nr:thermonuclease family protein [Defluviicoccus sp.]MDE0277942.1 thermonuclease family protein [Defluviicoccus sp.]